MTPHMTTVWVGLGSNLGDPKVQLDQAVDALRLLACGPQDTFLVSPYYASKPQGPQDQPDFMNAVVCLQTDLDAQALLEALQSIECRQGKIKRRHWGEREIDLDLLLYGQQTFNFPHLVVPHPFLTQRDFVLLPLLAISPDACLPTGVALSSFVAGLGQTFVYPIIE